MKFVITTILMGVLLMGCVPTTQDIQLLNNDIDNLMEKVDDYQVAAEDVKDKVFEEIDKVQEHVVVMNDAMKGQDGTIEKLIAGNATTAAFNPYAPVIDALLKGLLGLTTVGGTVGIGLGVRAAKKEKDLRKADKVGREKTIREITAMADSEITAAKVDAVMYANIGEARARINAP